MVEHPVPAVLAVLAKEGAVLLVRRANPPDAGLWGFPGGKIERGETLAVAALRELSEETGVRAAAGAVIDALDVIQGGHHFILVAVLCHWQGGDPMAGDDAEEARWVALGDLRAGRYATSEGVVALAERAVELTGRA